MSPVTTHAQQPDPRPFAARDAGILGSAVLTWAIPNTIRWNEAPADCGPCDPAGVPMFDRWMIREPIGTWSSASDFTRAGLALATWFDLARAGRPGAAGVVASLESVMWAEAITHLAKTAFGRKRPGLYSDAAPELVDITSNQRSMPSGHTSTAFALATSYWLSRRHVTADDRPWLRWVAMAAAGGVGLMRITAGKHYPSDVLIGAGVGIASAVAIHRIKF